MFRCSNCNYKFKLETIKSLDKFNSNIKCPNCGTLNIESSLSKFLKKIILFITPFLGFLLWLNISEKTFIFILVLWGIFLFKIMPLLTILKKSN